MDRIFNEIKRAIEEEMANQEANRPGGSPRPSGQSGRDAERYEAWLREEQERLRGQSATDQVQEPEVREERPRDGRDRRRSQDGRDRQSSQDVRDRQRSRQQRGEQPLARVQQPARATQHDRSEARHQRRLDSAYDERRGRTLTRGEIADTLKSGHGVRKAILLSEIVGRPVSLRRQDDHLIS